MMVDGSPRRIAPPPQSDNKQQQQQRTKHSDKKSGAETEDIQPDVEVTTEMAPSSSEPPANPAESTIVNRSSRSRWMKLRTSVQLSGAMKEGNKKPPLKREDSFLKRFSTRQMPDPNASEGSARRGADGIVKSSYFGSWRSVVNPDENILFYWLSLLTICLLYNAWTIIVRQAFPELQYQLTPVWFCLDGFTDIVFILDIVFQFRTGYLEQGLMVCESGKLAGHYFKSKNFLMDLIAITPLDFAQFQTGIYPIVRFPRFLKVYRSFRFYYMVESRTIYPNLWRVVNLIHILLLLAHWFGCFYYMLSELEGFVGEWSYRKPIGEYANLSRKYLGSVYWSTLTLTTIGDLATPATNLQYLFTIISYLIGVFIFATIVGQVGNVITNRNASRLEFERLLDGAKLYMRHHKVPRNMQRRVQRWYDYSWSRGRMQGGGDINSALGILPDKLKTELALHVNLKTLKKVSIFQECQPEFLHDLVLKMKAYIFTPGDLICRKGEVAREMFIIADGILEVLSETGRVLTQMKAGDFFGEIGILNLDGFNRRTADVRSVGYSELFSLSREDILTAMKDYPEAQEILQTMGRKRLMEARLAANEGKKGNNASDNANSPDAKNQDSGKKIPLKPRPGVVKLKEDIQNLKKLFRTRSTPTGKSVEGQENIEMKQLSVCNEESAQSSSDNTLSETSRPRTGSFKKFMKKLHFKGDEGSTGVAGFTRPFARLSTMRLRSERSGAESSSVSTESSADSCTPLNKALPLLQRVRMLGEQERRSETRNLPPLSPKKNIGSTEVIGEGLPFLERIKLLRAKEQAQAKQSQLNTNDNKEEQQKPPPSPRSKSNPFSSLLSSAIQTSPKLSPKSTSPKKECKDTTNGKGSPVSLKVRMPESATELPLLKKVLLMKLLEDKKKDEENEKARMDAIDIANERIAEQKKEKEKSQEADSDRVYLEQFSRTLGFKMSADDVLAPPQKPRTRLNAMSLTPSPSNENINNSEKTVNEKPEEPIKKEPKKKSAAQSCENRKRRLSRMLAVREDSENSSVDDEEDPFVKSIECQTEVIRNAASVESLNGFETLNRKLNFEHGLQDYLGKVMLHVKQAMKSYVMEQQVELQQRILQLERDTKEKDVIINKLKSQLEGTNYRPSSTFDEVTSLEVSSISSSEDEEIEDLHLEVNPSGVESQAECEDDESRDLDDEEIALLQEKLRKKRKSWPSTVSIGRRILKSHKQSYSLDDEKQELIEMPDSEDLWRLEFPSNEDHQTTSQKTASVSTIHTIPEQRSEELLQEEIYKSFQKNISETKAETPPPLASNDWEVRMLVEQFEKNVKQQKRRHSSAEALSHSKVQYLRNIARNVGQLQTEEPIIRTGRKYSLAEEGSLRQWAECKSSLTPAKSSSYTSLFEKENVSSSKREERLLVTPARRKSHGHLKHLESRSARKSSLPLLPQGSSIGMSRWLSMDDAKSEGCRSQDSSLHTTLSSSYSQETVIDMESRFPSSEDLPNQNDPGSAFRFPSLVDVTANREPYSSTDFLTNSPLPDWPSSPCLPTITEDDQFVITTSPASSPCRSRSHDSLPQLPFEDHQDSFQYRIDVPHSSDAIYGTCHRRTVESRSVSRTQTNTNSTYYTNRNQDVSVHQRRNLSTTVSISDSHSISAQGSIAITIPENESFYNP